MTRLSRTAARRLPLALLVLQLSSSTACVSPTLYDWGLYEQDLYDAYKNPEKEREFVATLFRVIERSEKAGRVVPPGIYAEYGYQLYKSGQYDLAVEYMEKERANWVEAEALMSNVIDRIRDEQARRADSEELSGEPSARSGEGINDEPNDEGASSAEAAPSADSAGQETAE